MKKREDSWEKLDTEFDHLLVDMKPYVLEHPNKPGEVVLQLLDMTGASTRTINKCLIEKFTFILIIQLIYRFITHKRMQNVHFFELIKPTGW